MPVIEEGLRSTQAIDAILREYLTELVKGCDSLVLGCTHYPLLKPRLRRLWPRLALVDSAHTTAKETARLLDERALLARGGRGRLAICTNDVNEVFTRIAGRLFPGEKIHAVSLE
ncbi:MAG: aspartate/glutamate racemase family protein [Spirochaetes bacterium]|nr:aspartate/glutamate racemase family protein [Spirochaetota bacterium]